MKKFISTTQEIIIELIVLILKLTKAILMIAGLLVAIAVVSPFLILKGLIWLIKFFYSARPSVCRPLTD